MGELGATVIFSKFLSSLLFFILSTHKLDGGLSLKTSESSSWFMITLGISEIGCPLVLIVVGFVSMLTSTVFISLKNNDNLMAAGTCMTCPDITCIGAFDSTYLPSYF